MSDIRQIIETVRNGKARPRPNTSPIPILLAALGSGRVPPCNEAESPIYGRKRTAVDNKPATKRGGVYLVRHGRTPLNGGRGREDRIRGWNDAPLSPEGMREAQATGQNLRKSGIQAIVSSNLCRAYDSARIISAATGAPIVAKGIGLRPWNLGEFQGKPSAEVAKVMPYYVSHPEEKVPGGESYHEFFRRFIGTLQQLLRETEEPIAAVTHYRCLKLAEGWLAKGDDNPEIDMRLYFCDDSPTGSILQVYNTPDGAHGQKVG